MTLSDVFRDAVRHILINDWDPIGIAGEPSAQDEYNVYVSQVVGMLRAGRSVVELSAYLHGVETTVMGLRGDLARAQRAAEALRRL